MANKDETENNEKCGLCARCLRLFGIDVSADEDKFLVLTRRFPFVVLGFCVLGIIGFVGLLEFSSTPTFCGSCHYIKPYVDSWRESSHNMVTCTKCHFPPGLGNFIKGKVSGISELVKTVTRDQAPKPHAEIEDAACLREGCHETRLLEGKVTFAGGYRFDHGPHLTQLRRGKQLRCTSCHSQIVQGEHIAVTKEVCFTCHFKGHLKVRGPDPVAGCTACHDAPAEPVRVAEGETFDHPGFVGREVDCWKCHSDTVAGKGEVPKQVCRDCHAEPEHLARYDDTQFMHDWHVTRRKVECFQCHGEIKHGAHIERVAEAGDCSSCHTSDHLLPRRMFAGTGGSGVADFPGTHSEREVDCVACHELRSHGQERIAGGMRTYEAGEKACVECHGEGIKGMLAEWKSGLQSALQKAESVVAKARQAAEELPEGEARASRARKLLEEARHNTSFVGRAHGVHNPEYALRLLDRATAAAREVLSMAEEGGREVARAKNRDLPGGERLTETGEERARIGREDVSFHH
ncbi:MAG: NapC/NirT family cytochrome c [Planctomycetota bacterium]